MKPGLKVHTSIMGLLILVGFGLGLMEWTTNDAPGGLFTKYAFTRLYWLALAVYAVCSSAVVLLAVGIAVLRKRTLRPSAVVLCHIIPVGLVLTMLHLGVHDALQNLGQDPSRSPEISGQRTPGTQFRPPPVTPRLPAKALRYREAEPGPMTLQDQTPNPGTAVPTWKADDAP